MTFPTASTKKQYGKLGSPVEGTTTWQVNQILELSELARGCTPWEALQLRSSALLEFLRLHTSLVSGSPLPAYWPHAKELDELRAKVAKYETALRTIANYRDENLSTKHGPIRPHARDFEDVETIARGGR